MNYLKYSVGVDMGKEKFYGCISLIDEIQKVTIKATRNFANTIKGIHAFEAWIKKHRKMDLPLCITMEASGIYHENLAWYLFEKNYHVSIVLPTKAKNYLKSNGYRSKNDKIDARGIAQMGAEKNLAPWQPISKVVYQLRSLTRHLEHLHNHRTSLNNQLEAVKYGMYPLKEVEKSIHATLKSIDKEIDKIKIEIEKVASRDEILHQKIQKITTIKGLGLHTVVTIIAETNGFDLINNQRQLISYAGYDIVENQSGSHVGKTKISKKGNTHIRRALFMPAFCVVKHQKGIFKSLFDRVYEKNKIKMKGYVAVQKKLLCLIYTLWKRDQPFIENYLSLKYSSGNDETKPLFRYGFQEAQKEGSPGSKTGTTQDELPSNESTEALFR